MEGDRNFIMKNADGELCAEANARFIYFDLAGQKPLRVPEVEMEKLGTVPPLDTFTYAPRRMQLPKTDPVVCEPFAIQSMNIDTNHHVNNIAYIEMAVSLLPPESLVREMRVQYISQARLGDTLVPKCYCEDSEDGKMFTVSLEKADGELCAIVAFLLAPLQDQG
jgi:acyl-ACP thioesterase